MTEMECIFCKIAAKEMKASVVLETDNVVVINDISPQAPAHMLAIPKKHYKTILECKDTALLGELIEAGVSAARKAGVTQTGFRLAINTNEEGGQTVWHLHMHILGGRPLAGRLG